MKYNKQKRESKEKAKSSWQEFVSYYVKIPRNHNKYIGYGDRQRCKRKEGWWGGLYSPAPQIARPPVVPDNGSYAANRENQLRENWPSNG